MRSRLFEYKRMYTFSSRGLGIAIVQIGNLTLHSNEVSVYVHPKYLAIFLSLSSRFINDKLVRETLRPHKIASKARSELR